MISQSSVRTNVFISPKVYEEILMLGVMVCKVRKFSKQTVTSQMP